MAYIPAPARGALTISEVEPKNVPDTAWWDTRNGQLKRFSNVLAMWVPDGEPSPFVAWSALVLGRGSMTEGASAARAIAIGGKVGASSAVAIGADSEAIGTNSVAIGAQARVPYQSNAVAIGYGALADGSSSLAIGYGAEATDSSSVVIGYGATSASSSTLSLGYEARADGSSSLAIGYGAHVDSGEANGQAVGYYAHAAHSSAAYGYEADAAGSASIAAGYGARVHADAYNGAAFGYYANAAHTQSLALGYEATTTARFQAVIAGNELRVTPLSQPASSLVLHSPSGAAWRITVSDAGDLSASPA